MVVVEQRQKDRRLSGIGCHVSGVRDSIAERIRGREAIDALRVPAISTVAGWCRTNSALQSGRRGLNRPHLFILIAENRICHDEKRSTEYEAREHAPALRDQA